jgi:hypothetical protein
MAHYTSEYPSLYEFAFGAQYQPMKVLERGYKLLVLVPPYKPRYIFMKLNQLAQIFICPCSLSQG